AVRAAGLRGLDARSARDRLVLPGRRGAVPAPEPRWRRDRALHGRGGRLFWHRPPKVVAVQPDPDLAPSVGDLRRRDGLPGRRHLPCPLDRRARAAWPRAALGRAARRAGGGCLRQPGGRVSELPRPPAPRAAVVLRGVGMGIPRAGAVLDVPADHRDGALGGDHLPGAESAPCRGEPGQPALVVSLQLAVDPGVLRGRPADPYADPIRNRRLLAVLGRPPVGRGFPGAVHHDAGGLDLRAHGDHLGAVCHAADLLRGDALLGRRRGRDAAPLLFQRWAGGRDGPGGVLLGRRGHPADLANGRSLVVPPAWQPTACRRRAGVPASLGGVVPGLGRVLELPRRWGLRLPHQPAGRELLRDRHAVDLESRPRRLHGRVRYARAGTSGILYAVPGSARGLERGAGEVLVLGDQCRPDADDPWASVPAGRLAAW